MKQINKIGNLNVTQFTNANLIVYKTIEIEASPEQIFKIVSDHSIFSKWMPMVKHVAVLDNTNAIGNDGVGCERICTFGSDKIREKVLYVEKNKVFAYQASDTPMFKNHLAVVEIINKGYNKSQVNYYVYFSPIGIKGFMMKNMMLPMVLKRALKNLKIVVAFE